MKELAEKILALCENLKAELGKENNKAAAARARKITLELEKLGKLYRKESVKATKN